MWDAVRGRRWLFADSEAGCGVQRVEECARIIEHVHGVSESSGSESYSTSPCPAVVSESEGFVDADETARVTSGRGECPCDDVGLLSRLARDGSTEIARPLLRWDTSSEPTNAESRLLGVCE